MASNPSFEPRFRLWPRILLLLRWRFWPWYWFRATPRLVPGTVVLSTADGMIHVCSLSDRTSADRALLVVRSFASSGAGAVNWDLPQLILSPDEQRVAVSEIEYLSDAVDFRVTLFATGTGTALFTATDNSLPPVSFRGDDPEAPEPLRAAQAESDAFWAMEVMKFPEVPRPILMANWFEEPGRATLAFAGWMAGEQMLLRGACPIRIEDGSEFGGITDPIAWWGVAARIAGEERWEWTMRAVGLPPADIVVLARPARTRRLEPGLPVGDRGGTALLLDSVAQSDPALAPGVVSFDGPFIA